MLARNYSDVLVFLSYRPGPFAPDVDAERPHPMYEMYPDRWTQDAEGQQKLVAERPHRRARKVHQVSPQIVIELEQLRQSGK